MKKIFIITTFILFSISSYAQFLGSTFCENFSIKETKLQPQNWSVAQDKRGIMYFANTGGVLEYDGVNWRQIRIENNYPVRAVCTDDKGRIYVGGIGAFGYLAPDKKGELKYYSISSLLDSSVAYLPEIWEILSIKNEIYFQTNKVIYKFSPYNNPDSIFDVSPENLKKIQVFDPKTKISTMFNLGNTCYFNTGSLCKIENDKIVLLPFTEDKFKKGIIYSILPYSKNKFIISLRKKLLFYNLNAKSQDEAFSEFKTEADDFFSKNHIYCATSLSDNKYAFGTSNGGTVIIDKTGKMLDVFSSDNGLNDDNVLDVFYKDNIIWYALNNGISIVESESPFRFWNKKNNIDGVVLRIIEFENTLYLSTFGGIVYNKLDSTNRICQNIQFKKLPNVTQATWDFKIFSPPNNQKKLLLAACTNGFFEIKNNQPKMIEHQTRYSIAISKINPDIIFAGSATDLSIFKYNNGAWNKQEIKDLKGLIISILETENGDIWLGTYFNGVYLIKKNEKNNFDFSSADNYEIIHYDTTFGLPSLQPTRVYQINNELLFATYQGLYKFNEQEQKFYSTNDFGTYYGDEAHAVGFLLFEKNGDIWADGNMILKLQKDGTYLLDTIFSKRLPTMLIPSMYQLNDSIILFGSADGLFSYNKKMDKRNFPDFNAYIREVITNDDSVLFFGTNYLLQADSIRTVTNEQAEQLISTLKYKNNSIIFHYAAGFYVASDKITYSYRLKGYKDQWSEWTRETKKEYTNLYEGHYTFQIKAKNIYGTISSVASYEFKILPPWYRTWWAYIIYAILFVLLIFIIVKIALRRVVKAKIRLEEIVKQRTAEISQQKEEIQTQADNLEEANIELSQQKEEIQAQAEVLELTNLELEKLSIVASETDNAVLIFDKELYLEWTNEAFAKIYGFTFEEFTKTKRINLIIESDKTNIQSLVNKCINEKTSVSYETESVKKSGDNFWVQTTLTPIFDDNNNLKKIIGIETDITKIKKAQEEIFIQNKFIKSSITYAQTIQQAILPIKEDIEKYLNIFVLFRPKDIVSGDFYWFSSANPSLYIAAIDCTGHGVPGAFMSMIASQLLNEIVNEKKIFEPKNILSKLNLGIRKSLKQDITENHDGMDVCLCQIEKTKKTDIKVVFSGAKRPLFYFKSKEKELYRAKGSRKTIGGNNQKYNIDFTNHELLLNKGDLLYLTTDGYIDQNNAERKSFGSSRLKKIFTKIANKELTEQKQILETELDNWQKDEPQRDDITVIGIKI